MDVRPLKAIIVVPLVAGAVVAAGGTIAAGAVAAASAAGPTGPSSPGPRPNAVGASAPTTGPTGPTGPAGAAGQPVAAPGQTAPPGSPPQSPTSLTRLPNSLVIDGSAPLTVTLSAPVSPTSPPPTLIPHVAGTWKAIGDSDQFTPASTLEPCSHYSLTVWADTTATGHARLGRRRTLSLHVACPPVSGLQQALAKLGYLGARFRPLRRSAHLLSARPTRRQAALAAFHPPPGMLAPSPSDAPRTQLGALDPVTRGALEVYQADRGLAVTGEPNSATWDSLLYDETVDRHDPHPYTWVVVTETLPETLFLHRSDRVPFTTPVNTGVPGAETALGVFPIYARYVSTSMAGEDPDGVKYDVPDVPWVNYFNGGDAVHGYPREAYGFPQSNGCVELPIEASKIVYSMLQIGDIVEVTG